MIPSLRAILGVATVLTVSSNGNLVNSLTNDVDVWLIDWNHLTIVVGYGAILRLTITLNLDSLSRGWACSLVSINKTIARIEVWVRISIVALLYIDEVWLEVGRRCIIDSILQVAILCWHIFSSSNLLAMRQFERSIDNSIEGASCRLLTIHYGEVNLHSYCAVAWAVFNKSCWHREGVRLTVVESSIVEGYRTSVPCCCERSAIESSHTIHWTCLYALVEGNGYLTWCRNTCSIVSWYSSCYLWSISIRCYLSSAKDIHITHTRLRVVSIVQSEEGALVEGVAVAQLCFTCSHNANVNEVLTHCLSRKIETKFLLDICSHSPLFTQCTPFCAISRYHSLPILWCCILSSHISLKLSRSESLGRELILPCYLSGVVTILIETVDAWHHRSFTTAHYWCATSMTVKKWVIRNLHYATIGITVLIPCEVSSEWFVIIGVSLHFRGIEHCDEVLHLIVGCDGHIAFDSDGTWVGSGFILPIHELQNLWSVSCCHYLVTLFILVVIVVRTEGYRTYRYVSIIIHLGGDGVNRCLSENSSQSLVSIHCYCSDLRGWNGLAVSILPLLEEVAQITLYAYLYLCTFIINTTCWVAWYASCTCDAHASCKIIWSNSINSACYIACYDNIAEGILFVVCQILNIYLHKESVCSSSYRAKVEVMFWNIRIFLSKLRVDIRTYCIGLGATYNDNVEATTISAYLTSLKWKALRSKGQRLLRFESENYSSTLVISRDFFCWLEHLTYHRTIRTQSGKGKFFAPRQLSYREQIFGRSCSSSNDFVFLEWPWCSKPCLIDNLCSLSLFSCNLNGVHTPLSGNAIRSNKTYDYLLLVVCRHRNGAGIVYPPMFSSFIGTSISPCGTTIGAHHHLHRACRIVTTGEGKAQLHILITSCGECDFKILIVLSSISVVSNVVGIHVLIEWQDFLSIICHNTPETCSLCWNLIISSSAHATVWENLRQSAEAIPAHLCPLIGVWSVNIVRYVIPSIKCPLCKCYALSWYQHRYQSKESQ